MKTIQKPRISADIQPVQTIEKAMTEDDLIENVLIENEFISEVKPERPPSAIPEALSTYVVMVELPIIAPIVVPIASDIIASFTCGLCPSSPMIPVCEARPTNVPTVSNIFINNKVKITTAISSVKNSEKSNLQNVGSIEWGMETGRNPSGISVTPSGMPIRVQIRIL